MKHQLAALGALFAFGGCGASAPAPVTPATGSAGSATTDGLASGGDGDGAAPWERPVLRTVTSDQLRWEPLPYTNAMYVIVSGDPTAEPTSFFVKHEAGAGATVSHNTDEYTVTISGTFVNPQDGGGTAAPLPPASYWFEPAGTAHTTACSKEAPCIAFTHTRGTFRVDPATPGTGTPSARYLEKRLADLTFVPLDVAMPELGRVAYLWGDSVREPHGMLVKIASGVAPLWHVHKFDVEGVVLAGTLVPTESGQPVRELRPGSWWSQPRGNKHAEVCKAGGPDCLVYMHVKGAAFTKRVE